MGATFNKSLIGAPLFGLHALGTSRVEIIFSLPTQYEL
jgi:hypothetical protein